MQVFKQTGKEFIEEGVTTGFKQGFKNAMLNAAGYEYKGKTLGMIAAYGAEMATDGALSGMVENGFRTAYEGGDVKEVLGASISGGVSGLAMAPLIGGGMRGAGKVTRMFFGKSPDVDAPTRVSANNVKGGVYISTDLPEEKFLYEDTDSRRRTCFAGTYPAFVGEGKICDRNCRGF